MKILVATHSYLFTAEITDDFEVGEIEVIDEDYYYGCDYGPKGLLACKRNEPLSKRSTTGYRHFSLWPEPPRLRQYDVIDVHQVTYGHGGFYYTSTGNNEILHDVSGRWTFGPGARDLNHINSIFVEGDNVYLVFHNLAARTSEIKLLHNDKTYELQHYSIHNLIVSGEDFYYNASDNGAIARAHFGSDEVTTCVIGTQWHPKGMTSTDDLIISGFSEHAVETPRRFISESGLVFIEKKTMKEVGRVTLQQEDGRFYGNINEIRLCPAT